MALNERQQALYDYLEKQGDQWTTQMNVAYALDDYYSTASFFGSKEFHDSKARQLMTKDIQAINDSEDIQKVVLSGVKGIKISTEQEFNKYIKRQYISVFKRLNRVRKKERKGSLNGQTVFGENFAFVDAFLNENENLGG